MKSIHLVGNAHLDPVWLWRFPQGAAEIKATFASALQRMEEQPGYIFTAGAVSYYEWVMENEPAMFAQIRRRVQEGRWVPVGGWWVQPDCNAPSGESFARHTLLGQGFLKEKLGHAAKVGYNVDSFGHNAGLPQILRQSGMKYYVMMRPGEHEKHLPTVFWWEGADGSRVLVQRIIQSYETNASATNLPEKLAETKRQRDELDLPLMFFYGVGNHGGGPTVSTLEHLKEEMKRDSSILFSDPERYFAEMEKLGDKIPVVKGDLQHHASGCYSTDAVGKRNNRAAEQELTAAEKMMTAANRVLGLPYAKDELERGWKNLLFNQFHDLMGGCSIRVALEDMHQDQDEGRAIARRNLNRALQKIAWNIDTAQGKTFTLSKDFDPALWETQAGGAPLVVFNTLPWPVTGPVTLYGLVNRVEDEQGRPVATQMVRADRTLPDAGSGKSNTLFFAQVPAMGYRVYRAGKHLEAPAVEMPRELKIWQNGLENSCLKVELDEKTGQIRSIFDKKLNREMLAGPAGCVVINDTASDTWAHGIFSFREEKGRFGDAVLQARETGPLRVTLRSETHYGNATLKTDYTLYPGEEKLDMKLQLFWTEPHCMVKLALPLALDKPKAAWEQAYAVCEKEPDGREMPAQTWGDLSDDSMGMTLVNDSKYSYDALDGELRLTLVRTAAFADHAGPKWRDDFTENMDLGEQTIRVTLLPHGGSWHENGAARAAAQLLNPLIPLAETWHNGPLPMEKSFAQIGSDCMSITAIKPAEDGRGMILRVVETAGKGGTAHVKLPMADCEFDVELGALQFATYRILNGKAQRVNLMEENDDNL